MHQINLIIGSDKLGFWERGKAEYLGTKLLGISEKTNNKLNPHIHLFWTTNLQPLVGGKWLALLLQNMEKLA